MSNNCIVQKISEEIRINFGSNNNFIRHLQYYYVYPNKEVTGSEFLNFISLFGGVKLVSESPVAIKDGFNRSTEYVVYFKNHDLYLACQYNYSSWGESEYSGWYQIYLDLNGICD